MHYGIVPRFKAREKDLSASHQTIIGYGCPLASSGDNLMSEAELSSREWEHWLGKGHLDGDPPPNTHISIYYEQQRQKWRSKHKIFMEQSEQGRRIGKDVKYSITSGMSRLKRRIQKPFLGGNVHPKVDFPPFRYNIF